MRTGRRAAALIVAVGLASCAPRSQPPAAAPTPPGPFIAEALDVDPEDVYIRVVDVGPGLCVIIRAPGDHFMVYDAGHWVGQHCVAAVRELVTTDAIDLLVISHSDGDHLGDAADILAENAVSLTLLAGEPRETTAWKDLVAALATEVTQGGSVHNLQSVPLVPGRTIPLGEAVVTLVAGWKEWTAAGLTASERRNAISVVVRLDYRGRSVLFTGDTVGRRLNDPDSACKDAEKIMVDNHVAGTVSLKADVLIASHHGANNGSSDCFIQAIAPQFVVFSSGHDHEHPTLGAATRFLNKACRSRTSSARTSATMSRARSSGRSGRCRGAAIRAAMMMWRSHYEDPALWMSITSELPKAAIPESGRRRHISCALRSTGHR
jgi:beta-lactamase superfamily II metal-dependent hydrolase